MASVATIMSWVEWVFESLKDKQERCKKIKDIEESRKRIHHVFDKEIGKKNKGFNKVVPFLAVEQNTNQKDFDITQEAIFL